MVAFSFFRWCVLQRPAYYNTKHSKVILAYLASEKEIFLTAAQIEEHLHKEQVVISRPTVYRQLEKLVSDGKIRKYTFDGSTVSCFQYVDPNEDERELYHLKCEVCDEVLPLKCDEVFHVARHILETHDFQVNDSKTVFYGKCRLCLQA